MDASVLKEYIALFGGLLSAILLFLQALGIELVWFNDHTIETFTNALIASIPFVLVIYGVCKNSKFLHKNKKDVE